MPSSARTAKHSQICCGVISTMSHACATAVVKIDFNFRIDVGSVGFGWGKAVFDGLNRTTEARRRVISCRYRTQTFQFSFSVGVAFSVECPFSFASRTSEIARGVSRSAHCDMSNCVASLLLMPRRATRLLTARS